MLLPREGLASLPEGVRGMVVITDNQGKPRLDAVMAQLADEGMTSVMVEAGGRFVATLLAAGLVDRLVWMRKKQRYYWR